MKALCTQLLLYKSNDVIIGYSITALFNQNLIKNLNYKERIHGSFIPSVVEIREGSELCFHIPCSQNVFIIPEVISSMGTFQKSRISGTPDKTGYAF